MIQKVNTPHPPRLGPSRFFNIVSSHLFPTPLDQQDGIPVQFEPGVTLTMSLCTVRTPGEVPVDRPNANVTVFRRSSAPTGASMGFRSNKWSEET